MYLQFETEKHILENPDEYNTSHQNIFSFPNGSKMSFDRLLELDSK